MKKTTSRKRHLFLTKNFILMLVMLVVIVMAVSAWFTVYKSVDATNITVKAVSTEIDIAECIKTYDSNYNVLTDGPGQFGSNVTFTGVTFNKDCTGDGMTLIVPEFNVTKDFDSVRLNGGKEVDINQISSPARSNEESNLEKLRNPNQDPPEYQYAEFEFYVRSKNENLFLDKTSMMISSTETGTSQEGKHALSNDLNLGAKKSAYGDFNVDGLVGAMRVALIGEPCSRVTQNWEPSLNTTGARAPDTTREAQVRQILWIPRPDVYLNIPTTVGDISTWTLSTGVTPETQLLLNNSEVTGITYKHSYYYDPNLDPSHDPTQFDPLELVDDNDAVCSSETVDLGVDSSNSNLHVVVPNLGKDTNISDFGDYHQPKLTIVDGNEVEGTWNYVSDEYYVTKYTLRVWIEGTDTEARRAMDGGEFDLMLYFK